MSIARIKTQKAAKPYTCDKCGTGIKPKDEYRSYKVGFRSRHVNRRCMKAECTPRSSELESSKLADVYAAIEDAEDQIVDGITVGDAESVLEELGSRIREVAEEYREASTDDNGTVFNTDAEERADALESVADEVSSYSCEPLDEGEEECTNCGGTGEVENEDDLEHSDDEPPMEDCSECGGTGKVDSEDPLANVEDIKEFINGLELP